MCPRCYGARDLSTTRLRFTPHPGRLAGRRTRVAVTARVIDRPHGRPELVVVQPMGGEGGLLAGVPRPWLAIFLCRSLVCPLTRGTEQLLDVCALPRRDVAAAEPAIKKRPAWVG